MDQVVFDFLSRELSLSEAERDFLVENSVVKFFEKGTILLREGQFSNNEYFVFRGCLRTYFLIDGKEKTTAFFTALEPLSPVCVATKAPSEYFISCPTDALVLVSDPEMEQKAFVQFPQFERLCRISSEKLLAKKQEELNSFKTSSPEQRYLDLLETRPELLQMVPQHQLASYLGITPQSLSRLRGRLLKNKLL